ncbi:hypothetical protein TNCV_922111 [Trichonephila clavipes]|nr:hypothetical protein TNCV_922111 [Trichonephila clavipes]
MIPDASKKKVTITPAGDKWCNECQKSINVTRVFVRSLVGLHPYQSREQKTPFQVWLRSWRSKHGSTGDC